MARMSWPESKIDWSSSAGMVVTDSGTSWRFSAWRSAVTTTVSTSCAAAGKAAEQARTSAPKALEARQTDFRRDDNMGIPSRRPTPRRPQQIAIPTRMFPPEYSYCCRHRDDAATFLSTNSSLDAQGLPMPVVRAPRTLSQFVAEQDRHSPSALLGARCSGEHAPHSQGRRFGWTRSSRWAAPC